jgi:hypothetical protein
MRFKQGEDMSNTGGPAFPCPTISIGQHQGMTLRDYFAAKAMQALLEKFDEMPVEIAYEAYTYADMMMKAREQ